MATIRQLNPTTWTGDFNARPFRITKARDNTAVTYTDKDVPVIGDELRSLMRFYGWHIASKRDASELPTLYALNIPAVEQE